MWFWIFYSRGLRLTNDERRSVACLLVAGAFLCLVDQAPTIMRAVFPGPSVAQAQAAALPLLEQNYAATYKVEVTSDGNGWGHGSGEVLSTDGYLLTCDHVVGDAQRVRIRVREQDGTIVALDAEVIATDPVYDLGVIKVPHRFNDTVVIGDPSLIKFGSPIYNVGFPYSAGKTFGYGYITQAYVYADPEDPEEPVTDRLFMDIPDGHGTSGSGIYSSETGHLIGIMKSYNVFARDRSPLFVRRATPVTKIIEFLDKHHIPYRSAVHPASELQTRDPR